MKDCTSRAFGFHWCLHICHCHGCSLTLSWLVSYSYCSCECKMQHPPAPAPGDKVSWHSPPHTWVRTCCLPSTSHIRSLLPGLSLSDPNSAPCVLPQYVVRARDPYLVSRKWGSELNFFPLKEVSCWATKNTLAAAAASPPLSSPPPVMVKIKRCSSPSEGSGQGRDLGGSTQFTRGHGRWETKTDRHAMQVRMDI